MRSQAVQGFFFDENPFFYMAVIAYLPEVTILFGIINTVCMHLAKSFEKQGIEVYDQIRMVVKGEKIEGTTKEKLKKPAIYLTGVVLNNLSPLWAFLSSLFGPITNFTSMYGLGLIALLIYSRKVLNEEVHKIEFAGAIAILLGTIIIGFENLFLRSESPAVSIEGTIISSIIIICYFLVMIGIVLKQNNLKVMGFVFGLAGGGIGVLDPMFKKLYTDNMLGLMNFVALALSFGFGFLAFAITQWGFARKARANILVPAYNSTYILLPIVVSMILISGYEIYITTVVGFALIIVGIVLMRAFKPETGLNVEDHVHEHSNSENELEFSPETREND